MPDNNIIDAAIDRLIEAAAEFGEYDTVPNRFKLRDAKSEVIALFDAQKQECDRLRALARELAESMDGLYLASDKDERDIKQLLARPDVKELEG